MHGNNVIKKGNTKAGNCQAKKLIAASRVRQAVLDQTIELEGIQPDVKIRPGKYGLMAFVRSKFSYFHFFVVSQKHGEAWKCSCGGGIHQNGKICPHIKSVWIKIDSEKETEVA